MRFLSSRERNNRRVFSKLEEVFLALKSISVNQTIPVTVRWEASLRLTKLVKNKSKIRFKNRCFLTGRGRSNIRFFNLSRIKIREYALSRQLPFIDKSSW
jgi:small subunit ribosomal protein S14